MKKSIEEIYKILTHRKVRRAWPKNPAKIRSCIKNSLKSDQSLVFTIEWLGVKTADSGRADNADRLAISFIRKNIIEKLLKAGVKKVIVKILFADTNASYVDGYSKKRINLYWKTFKKIVYSSGRNFKLIKISKKLYPKIFKLDGKENIQLKEIAERTKAVDIFKKTKRKISTIYKEPYLEIIDLLSKKHSLLAQNKALTIKEVTKRYIFLRVLTSILYKKIRPNEISFSYTYPKINNLILSQPTIYVFSIYKGCSECPWFISDKNKTVEKIIKNKFSFLK